MKRVEEILIRCIDDIKSGRATLAECFERYPDIRTELEPLLKVALSIKEKPGIQPSESFKTRARTNLMEHIHASQSRKTVEVPLSQPGIRFSWFTGWARAVSITVAVVLVFAAAGTRTVYASQPSLPGDTFYSVKLGTEQIQRIFTFDAAADVELELKFASIRLDEMDELASMPADQTSTIDSGGGKKLLTMSVISFTPTETKKTYITPVERIEQSAAGYKKNLNLAITKSEQVSNPGLLEKVASAILNHFDRLDEIGDKASGELVQVIAGSKTAAFNGYKNAVSNLASVNPVRASEINRQALQNRQERAEAEAVRGNGKGSQDALQEIEKLRRFGNELLDQIGRGSSENGTNNETNSSTPGEQQGTPGSDNGQSSQEIPGDTNPSDQGQGTQNQTQQDSQGNTAVEPSTSEPETVPSGTGGNIQQPENTPDSSGDGATQSENSSRGTGDISQQSGQSSSESGHK